MLFNSYAFIFLFLPLTFAGFFLLARMSHVVAAGWLAAASLFFYGWWNPLYVGLLMASIVGNYVAGGRIARAAAAAREREKKGLTVFAVAANLALLGYYKYSNFFLSNTAPLLGFSPPQADIILPLGISFFTFTQIAFLIDTYKGKVQEYRFVHYCLFVTYFPHLIAGPILHHAEMMPQFGRDSTYRFNLENFKLGSLYFFIGLFKKVVLADGIQPFVAPVFDSDPTYALTALEAWGGVLAYTLQLYFDFSGYSDMAIGLSKMINIDLPLNFNSPYKAANISDFWRRWHMTLSRFLRDYLYVPLGGNRHGQMRRYGNLMATMLLGGLWHGAGWTFVIWGGLHGLYLVVHQLSAAGIERIRGPAGPPSGIGRALSVLCTFLCVVVAWVFFRATSLESALRIIEGMAGLNGFALPVEWRTTWDALPLLGTSPAAFLTLEAFGGTRQLAWIAALLVIVWAAPNSQQLIAHLQQLALAWRQARWAWMSLGSLAVFVFMLAAINGSHGASEFIYFNF
jgi:D-alanyl-lipoteichoic acid acyltransferase DltB (MBOAT superfamily)